MMINLFLPTVALIDELDGNCSTVCHQCCVGRRHPSLFVGNNQTIHFDMISGHNFRFPCVMNEPHLEEIYYIATFPVVDFFCDENYTDFDCRFPDFH
jgi:hypothetical protein